MAGNGKEDRFKDHEEDNEDVIYEDEVLEMISLDGEDDQLDIEGISRSFSYQCHYYVFDWSDELEDLDVGAADLSGDSEEEEMGVTMFTPIRDDAVGCFTSHKG